MPRMLNLLLSAFASILVLPSCVFAQQSQNPSPMVEHSRSHLRLKEEQAPGKREPLEVGTLFIPSSLSGRKDLPLLVHFHGGGWLSELAASRVHSAVISIQIGSGSGVYAKAFNDPAKFGRLLNEAEGKAKAHFNKITLSGWSAGHGSIREILKAPEYFSRIDAILLIDGLHTGYVNGKPGPQESQLETENLLVFEKFAREAMAGRKYMLITHSEIFPGTFASTTETADWLLAKLGVKRIPVLRWGPMGTQQISEARAGRFKLLGYAGNTAPDHVDQLHSLPEYLKWLWQ